jgi:hypothetical protein
MADKMSAMAAVRAGYAAGVQPLGITRTFDENARPPVRTSDIVVSATQIKSSGTGAVTLATCPDGENWRVDFLSVFNTTAGSSTISIYLVPNGVSPGNTTNRVIAASVATLGTRRCTEAEGYQLLPGERLVAACTADNDFIAFARLTRITQGAT